MALTKATPKRAAKSKCLYDERWGKYMALVEKHEHDIYGNSKPGLRNDVVDLKNQVGVLVGLAEKQEIRSEKINENTEGMQKGLSALVRSQEDLEKWRFNHDKEAAELAKKAIEDAKFVVVMKDRKMVRVIAIIALLFTAIQVAFNFI